MLSRDAGYMRLCNRIFCQNPHITYFSAYNGTFKIAYAEIMLHMQKLHIYAAYYRAYVIEFFQYFFVQRSFKIVKYFWHQTITGIYNWTLKKLK